MPFGHQAVGRQRAVQRAGGYAVKIRQKFAADGTETIEIEVGIAKFERIEGPTDDANIAAEGLFPLEEFDGAADAAAPAYLLCPWSDF